MRKALIAVAVATALFAVGAFAASFTVNSEDIASGSDDVSKCADVVDVDFVTVYDNVAVSASTNGDWNVSQVELNFYDGAATTPTADCNGFGANLAVMTTSGTPAATGTATIAGGTATITLTTPLKASAITGASVLVDGENLQVASPGEGFPPTGP